jgi:tripartite-type tricarboxylate transporter receptor subunit TctC
MRIVSLLAGVALAGTAAAQSYPAQPIKMISPFPPGGSVDIMARLIADPLAAHLGGRIVIDNRSGASGNIGMEAAARSAPDGYTLFMGNNSTHGSNPALYAKLPYDAVNDFAPISMVASVPYVLVVNPTMPVNTLEQLIAMAKSQPGKINYASAGNGSTHHFCGELLKSMAGIDLVHVPYKGSPPGVAAVVAGEVGLMFANLTDIGGQLKAGRLKPLAVTSTTRASQLAETPTLSEAGLPGFEILSWFALLAPAGTPAPIISRLNAETVKVLARDDIKSTLGAQGLTVASSTPEALAAHIKSEIAKFTRIAKAAGVKAE